MTTFSKCLIAWFVALPFIACCIDDFNVDWLWLYLLEAFWLNALNWCNFDDSKLNKHSDNEDTKT